MMEGDITLTQHKLPRQYSKLEENICFRTSLNDLRTAGMYTDVCLACDSARLPAHKVILATKSKYFRELFSADDVNSADILVLQGMEPKIMEALLDFIYKGEINLRATPPDKLSLLVVAGLKIKIRGFRTYIICKILECLSMSTFRQALEISEILKSKEMESVVNAYIGDSLDTLWTSNDFLSLDLEKITVVFASAVHRATSQDVVLRAILSWVKHDREKREACLPPLVVLVKLNDITPAYVRFLLEDDPLMRDHPELHSQMKSVLVNNSWVDEDKDLATIKSASADTITKTSSLSKTALLPVAPSLSSSSVEGQQGTPRKIPSPRKEGYVSSGQTMVIKPETSQSTSIHTFRDEVLKPSPPLIIVVGRNEQQQLGVMYYSIKTDSWTDAEILQLPVLSNQGVLYEDNCVYAVGGEDLSLMTKLSICYMRDLETKKTRRLPDLRVPRSLPRLFMANGALYVAAGAGRYGSGGLSHVERLDSEEAPAWKNAATMRDKRDITASVCVYRGKIYVAGGGSPKVEFFSPTTKTWNEATSLPNDYHDLRCFLAVAGEQLWAFRDYKPSRVLMLDETKNIWKVYQTKGVCPEQVSSVFGWMNKIFVTDKCSALHVYDIVTCTWYYVNKVPKCLSSVESISVEDAEK